MDNKKTLIANNFFKIKHLEKITNSNSKFVSKDSFIERINIDSRTIDHGEWFICLKGNVNDGHKYIEEVLEKGAAGIIANPKEISKKLKKLKFPILEVNNPNQFLIAWASEYRKKFKGNVIGITGSNGKTSTKEILSRICKNLGQETHATFGNLNNLFGLPITILNGSIKAKWWIIEMGTNSFGEILKLTQITRPNGTIITDISESHLEFLKDTMGVAKEKSDILDGMHPKSPVIINSELKHLNVIRDKTKKYDLNLVIYNLNNNKSKNFNYNVKVLNQLKNTFMIKLNEEIFNFYNINTLQLKNLISCLILLKEKGVTTKKLVEASKKVNFEIKNRFQWKPFQKGWIIDDTYNANPGSFYRVLTTISKMNLKSNLIVIAGEMGELGNDSDYLHQKVGKFIYDSGCKNLLIYQGEKGIGYKTGWEKSGGSKKSALIFCNFESLLKTFYSLWSGNEIVLVKGSRSTKMERFINLIFKINKFK